MSYLQKNYDNICQENKNLEKDYKELYQDMDIYKQNYENLCNDREMLKGRYEILYNENIILRKGFKSDKKSDNEITLYKNIISRLLFNSPDNGWYCIYNLSIDSWPENTKNCDMLYYLMNHNFSIYNTIMKPNTESVLCRLIANKNIELVKLYLNKGYSPNVGIYLGKRPLELAEGNEEMQKILVKAGAV